MRIERQRVGTSGCAVLLLAGLVSACGGVRMVAGPGLLGQYEAPRSRDETTTAERLGRLDAKDPTIERGTYAERYSFIGRAGERVGVALESDELDPYVYIYDASGRVVAEDDDSGSDLNSAVRVTLPRDGVYIVVASTYAREHGDFRLRVERGTATGRYPVLELPADAARRFGAEAQRDDGGNPYHVYALELVGGMPLEARMESAEADSLLVLFDAAGQQVAMDDDGGGNLDALLVYRPQTTDTFFLVATTYSPPSRLESASYRLTASQ